MTKKKLIKDIYASAIQTVFIQLFGLIIFYSLSKYLSKSDFGEFNWSVAVGSTIIAISSLGIDLVYVKRIAVEEKPLILIRNHFFHTVLISIISLAVVVVIYILKISTIEKNVLFFLIYLHLLIANISNSFKLCLNGLEEYKKLAKLTLLSNALKLFFIILLYISNNFNVYLIVLAYILTSLFEFVIGYFAISKNISTYALPIPNFNEYKILVIESLPQLGVVIFDSALARIDWILLGIISTVAITAEYSFVYKIFELSKLPLLIIAPILLTRFSKLFNGDKLINDDLKKSISLFLEFEIFVIMIIPIILISVWSPLIDYFTDGKYGTVNELNYCILAICVPLMGIINFLWTIGFVQGQLKTIFYITIFVSIMNIALNALLIPYYNSLGSALSFLICSIIQLILYMKFIKITEIKLNLKNIILAFCNAIISVVLTKCLVNNIIIAPVFSLIVFFGLTLLTQQINLKEIKLLIRSKQP